MTRRRAVARAAALTAAIVAADQASKALARGLVARGDRDPILPGIALVNTRNRGIAFGLLESGGGLLVAFTAAALAVLVVVFALHARHRGAWVATGLLLGGALGNLIDRVRDGAVTDFIDLPLWPAFNLADVAITAGVFTLLWVFEAARVE